MNLKKIKDQIDQWGDDWQADARRKLEADKEKELNAQFENHKDFTDWDTIHSEVDKIETINDLDMDQYVLPMAADFLKGGLTPVKALQAATDQWLADIQVNDSDKALICPHDMTRTPAEEKSGKCRLCGRKFKQNVTDSEGSSLLPQFKAVVDKDGEESMDEFGYLTVMVEGDGYVFLDSDEEAGSTHFDNWEDLVKHIGETWKDAEELLQNVEWSPPTE